RMSHVKRSGDIGGRDHDDIRVPFRAWLKKAGFVPQLVPAGLDVFWFVCFSGGCWAGGRRRVPPFGGRSVDVIGRHGSADNITIFYLSFSSCLKAILRRNVINKEHRNQRVHGACKKEKK